MTFNRKIIIATVCALFIGCGAIPIKDRPVTDPKIQALLNTIKNEPNNIDALGRLGDFYRREFDEKKDTYYAHKSISYYEKITNIQPDAINAEVLIYDLYYRLHAQNKPKNFNRLVDQFNKLPESMYPNISPPEISEVYRLITLRKGNDEKTLELSLAGIKRNPKNPSAYIFAANNYLEGQHYTSAIALLKRGLREQPENINLLNSLGNAHEEKAYSNYCEFNDINNWKKAIDYASRVKKLDSENLPSRATLTKAYLNTGQKQLGLNEIKKANILDNENIFIKTLLMEAYTINGKFSESHPLVNDYIQYRTDKSFITYNYFAKGLGLSHKEWKESFNKYNALDFAQKHIRNGYWDQSLMHYRYHDYRQLHNYSIYPIIRSKIAATLSDSTWQANYKLRPKQHSLWEQALINYWEGEIYDSTLLGNATNRCKKVEANTYIGYRLYEKGDYINAKKHLSAAREQKLTRLIEDSLALHLLNKIETEL